MNILKISVLTNGGVLLDGHAIGLTELTRVFDAAPQDKTIVWYYRENGTAQGPEVVPRVMKLIADHRLPVRLSTKPDFSNSVADDLTSVFAEARQRAAKRQLVVMRHSGQTVSLPAMPREQFPPESVAVVEKMLPSSVPRKVAVIADTAWAEQERPSIAEAGRAVPFFGLVMGLSVIGHAVLVFKSTSAMLLTAGCREAELVIVDSAQLPAMPADWQRLITPVVKMPEIQIFDRGTGRFRKP